MEGKLVLGIESTAHTLGVGIAEGRNGKIFLRANAVEKVPHTRKGFVPRLLAEHHARVFKRAVWKALDAAGVSLSDFDGVAFSQGPGIGHALRVGFVGARSLSDFLEISLLPVHHGIAHVEVGKWEAGLRDPLVLYVSGGNTQIMVLEGRHYRVLGETLDVGVGNFLDVLAREFGLNNAVEVMQHAEKGGNLLDFPYTIKGMNVSFTGLLTNCVRNFKPKVEKGKVSLEDVCFSAQETVFAILTEATERALLHSEKKEVLVCGGVACNTRLQEMLGIMCRENGAKFGVASNQFNTDNGFMIALVGLKMLGAETKLPAASSLQPVQRMRPEAQEITWVKEF
ncbi:MAG: tRNA (adenosine(37)-N6)-threonylcarbamoyltransferase complex transferase subunit TsaD [Candidatus Micrarchaeota archaeon]